MSKSKELYWGVIESEDYYAEQGFCFTDKTPRFIADSCDTVHCNGCSNDCETPTDCIDSLSKASNP